VDRPALPQNIQCRTSGRGSGEGFTLTEVVVTVGLVGLLLAMVVPGVRSLRQNAMIKHAEADLAMIEAAIRKLAWDTGRWPTQRIKTGWDGREVWDLSHPRAGLTATDGRYPNWKGPYITRIPDDPWGNPYFVDTDYYHQRRWRVAVGSFGPNGRGRNYYDGDNVFVLLDTKATVR
jgi:general secretion pathway protein G